MAHSGVVQPFESGLSLPVDRPQIFLPRNICGRGWFGGQAVAYIAENRAEEVAMSATGLDVFDKTIQTTNIWLDEIMHEMGPDRQVAWHILGAVLRTMRDRLPAGLAAHLGAQLPLIVRGAYYDQYEPAAAPDKSRTLEEFLSHVNAELKSTRPVNSREAVRVVCSVLARHIDDGQMRKVWQSLPEDVRRVATANVNS
jgi:uncharacterized protein (DUF2267 family)